MRQPQASRAGQVTSPPFRDARLNNSTQLYVPPSGDEPLDDIELALVRALVGIIVRELREEAVADRAEAAR